MKSGTPTSGKAVGNLTIATTFAKHTEYHRIVAWEKQAEKLGERFHKGGVIVA